MPELSPTSKSAQTPALDAALAAITETLAEHRAWTFSGGDQVQTACWCGDKWRTLPDHSAHQADRVRAAVTALPPEQLAALIGTHVLPRPTSYSHAVGGDYVWVPDRRSDAPA